MRTAHKYSLLILFVTVICFNSCKEIFTGGKINEGKIVFDITYLDNERENPIIVLLPGKMELKFKNNNTKGQIEGFWGTFNLTFISKSNIGMNYSLLRFLDKKYIYEADSTLAPFGYKAMKDLVIIHTNETTDIAGFNCNISKAVCPQISADTIMLYHTADIQIDNPNMNNPFKEIKGVLLGFQVNLNAINMRFIAKEVLSEDIEDDEFNIPDGYKKVSREEMERIIDEYNNPTKK